jgi:hypothetical protein
MRWLLCLVLVLALTACQSKVLGIGPGVMYYADPSFDFAQDAYAIHYPPVSGRHGDVWNFVLTRGDDVTQLRFEFFGSVGPVEVNYRP